MRKFVAAGVLALSSALALFGCTLPGMQRADAPVTGVVEDGNAETFKKVADATVWLIPSADVAALGKTTIEIKKNATNDEPLEDSLVANRARYLKARTNAKGEFSFGKVPDGKYFVYVEPANSSYLPGGDKSRKALSAAELSQAPLKVKVSGNTPAGATYIGSTRCMKCHEDQQHFTGTLHRLGIGVVGKPSKLQDYSRFPEFNKGLDKLMAGTKFWFHGYDQKRGFDKYIISTKAPANAATVSFTATFFKDTDGKLKFRTENARDPADRPRIYPIDMTYGGGVYKQRYLVRVGENLFPFVQFNQEGSDAFADRTRKEWRDYHGDWFYNEQAGKLADPPVAKSFDKECASCHFNGYTLTKTAAGNYKAGASNDVNGELDIDGDGRPNELNMGCETCHGPGSAHDKADEIDMPSTIVSPGKLAAERSNMICGQCHSRPQGHLKNDQPVNKDNRMMLPGTARNAYLNEYTTREDAAKGDYWADGVHSKAHHQQYTDFIKSSKYRNATQLVSCADCHDLHGNAKFAHQLKKDPATADACNSCHAKKIDLKQHVTETTKCTADVSKLACASCHATKTMQTGSGPGKGLSASAGANYWMNDITSHVYDVPRKDNVGFKGVAPAAAMPIPYTNACGAACHKI